jgi:hypothetical protein
VVDQLCEKLTSEFYVERFLAGSLFVHLSQCGAVSVEEWEFHTMLMQMSYVHSDLSNNLQKLNMRISEDDTSDIFGQ